MHDRFVLLKRERDITDKESLLLSGWIKNYDELRLAYRLKEDFFKIYDAQSPDEAQGRYLHWKSQITPEIEPAFHDLVRAWDNWTPWILGYFDHPITNAYTEALNGVAKTINRAGRGYSFEVLRARLLFGKGLPSPSQPKPMTVPPLLEITPRGRAKLLDSSGSRCQSCHGVFERSTLEIHQTMPVVPGEHRKTMVVCRSCHTRFHTKELNQH